MDESAKVVARGLVNDGMSREELAKLLNLSPEAVNSLLATPPVEPEVRVQHLKELINEYGFAKRQLADAFGVSFKEFNTWFEANKVDKAFNEIDTFYDLVHRFYLMNVATTPHYKKEHVASWLETPFNLGDGYSITPWDIYHNNDITTTYSFYAQIIIHQITSQPYDHLIAKVLPGWRESKSNWEVFTASDGVQSIRQR